MGDAIDDLRYEIGITDDPEERYDLLVDLVRAFYYRGEYGKALEPAREALRAADLLEDRARRAGALRMIGGLHGSLAEYREAVAIERKALKIYRTLGDRQGEATMLLNIGISLHQLGEYHDSLQVLASALELTTELGLTTIGANVLMTTARVHAMLGNLHRSLDGLLQALSIMEDHDDPEMLLPSILSNIGITYSEAGELEEAEIYWRRALDTAHGRGDREVERISRVYLGNLHCERNEPEAALVEFEQALAIARELDFQAAVVLILGAIGRVHQMRREYDTALAYRMASLEAARGNGDRKNEIEEMWAVGMIHAEMGESATAIAMLRQALDLSLETGTRVQECGIHRDLSAMYENAGDIEQAFAHYRRSAEVHEEVLGREQQKAIDNLRMRHQIESAEKETEIYRLRNEKLRMELEHKHTELTAMALHLVQKNEVLKRMKQEVVRMVDAATSNERPLLRKLVPMIQQSIGSEQDWTNFEQQFTEVHPAFVEQLLARAPDLSAAELRVASLLRIQMSTKDIASLMSVTTRAIEKHRLQLRKKLGLSAETNLITCLLGL